MHRVMRGGNAVAREEILREGLAAFQLRRLRGRSEDAVARRAEAVDDAGDERAFRPHHRQRDAFALDQRKQAVDVLRIHADVAALRLRVAVPALPGATSTSDTRLDCASFQASACSRPPEPMTRTFMRLLPEAWINDGNGGFR